MFLEVGVYDIEWKIEGDLANPIFTDIKKTEVIVTKKGNIPIQISEMSDMPLWGTT